MATTCPGCGRPLDDHTRHIRFGLPDPLIGIDLASADLWMSDETVETSVFLEHPNYGSFVRALLPIQLVDGFSVTFGVWVGIPSDELRRSWEQWNDPRYMDLVLDGLLGNALPPWNLLGAAVRLEVRNPDHTPYCVTSENTVLNDLLTLTWSHDAILGVLPKAWVAT